MAHIDADTPNSSAPISKMLQIPSQGMSREEFMKKLSNDPRFKEAPKSGQGFVIVGATRYPRQSLSTPISNQAATLSEPAPLKADQTNKI